MTLKPICPTCGDNKNMIRSPNGNWNCHATHVISSVKPKLKPKCKLCQSTEPLTELQIMCYNKIKYLKVCKACKDYVVSESVALDEEIDRLLEEY